MNMSRIIAEMVPGPADVRFYRSLLTFTSCVHFLRSFLIFAASKTLSQLHTVIDPDWIQLSRNNQFAADARTAERI
jgi:hypothetical protein